MIVRFGQIQYFFKVLKIEFEIKYFQYYVGTLTYCLNCNHLLQVHCAEHCWQISELKVLRPNSFIQGWE